MKAKLFLTATAAALVALTAPSYAQEAKKPATVPSGETTPPGPAAKVEGTKESRKAERAEKRAEQAAANKKAAAPSGETTPPGPAAKVEGTKESRKAERAAKRKEIAEAEKKGQIPRPSETGAKQ